MIFDFLRQKHDSLRGERKKECNAVFIAIMAAIARNPVHNKHCGDVGPMKIKRESCREGTTCSVFVYLEGRDPVSGLYDEERHFALQFYIDSSNDCVRVIFDRYNPRIDGTLADLSDFLERARQHIEQWRLDEHQKAA